MADPLPSQSERQSRVREHFLFRIVLIVGTVAGAAMMDLAGWPYIIGFSGASLVIAAGMAAWQSGAHPETECRRCGGPNVSWFAPSPLWNAVMRGGSINGPWEHGELICPTCFVVLAEERGVAEQWRVSANAIHVALETTTPSGRVWDAETDRWRDS